MASLQDSRSVGGVIEGDGAFVSCAATGARVHKEVMQGIVQAKKVASRNWSIGPAEMWRRFIRDGMNGEGGLRGCIGVDAGDMEL